MMHHGFVLEGITLVRYVAVARASIQSRVVSDVSIDMLHDLSMIVRFLRYVMPFWRGVCGAVRYA